VQWELQKLERHSHTHTNTCRLNRLHTRTQFSRFV